MVAVLAVICGFALAITDIVPFIEPLPLLNINQDCELWLVQNTFELTLMS